MPRPKENVFCILITSSSIHICTLKQNSMSTCRQNKHTQRHLVEDEHAISNCEDSMIMTMFLAYRNHRHKYSGEREEHIVIIPRRYGQTVGLRQSNVSHHRRADWRHYQWVYSGCARLCQSGGSR